MDSATKPTEAARMAGVNSDIFEAMMDDAYYVSEQIASGALDKDRLSEYEKIVLYLYDSISYAEAFVQTDLWNVLWSRATGRETHGDPDYAEKTLRMRFPSQFEKTTNSRSAKNKKQLKKDIMEQMSRLSEMAKGRLEDKRLAESRTAMD